MAAFSDHFVFLFNNQKSLRKSMVVVGENRLLSTNLRGHQNLDTMLLRVNLSPNVLGIMEKVGTRLSKGQTGLLKKGNGELKVGTKMP